ncbi:MAG: RNase adapter RapZ [bacterium]|nr:RNase adapter RapZ [bacterium]
MAEQDFQNDNFIIVTGMSGAGKTLVTKCLEDQGYYCVDNIPPALLLKFAQLCNSSSITKLAIAIDVRSHNFFADIDQAIEELTLAGFSPQIWFVEANPEVLVRRFAANRRQHPLASDGRVVNGIEEEQKLLTALRSRASYIIDTSKLTPHQLRGTIVEHFNQASSQNSLGQVHVLSFGFKYGVPLDADLIFDCRFLPNPYYIPELKPLTGAHPLVSEYVFSFDATQKFVDKIIEFLSFVMPLYQHEGKNHVVVGFGCTGGRHRSAAIAAESSRRLSDAGFKVSLEHRDITKDDRENDDKHA